MFSQIVKLFKALNTNAHPGEIAHAVSIGMILGFVPKNNALWYLLFVFFLFVRIHKGSFFLTTVALSFAAYLFDPVFDRIGYVILNFAPLKGVYAFLLDIPFVAFTRFNNTVVAGAIAIALILYIPVYILIRILVGLWRTYLAPALSRSKFMQVLYKTPFAAKIAGFFTEV